MKKASQLKAFRPVRKRSVHVSLGDRSYTILVGSSLLAGAGTILRSALAPHTTRLAVISNRNVFGRYGEPLVNSLRGAGFEVVTQLVADGERYKTLRTVERICRSLVQHDVNRESAIVALGGGVIGDISGFVAACFLRGIPYIQVPTTMLAAVDSSVGGKTGVNLPEGKNLIGAFHQPRLVLTDVQVLQSLPARELRAGLYEALKYGVIADPKLFGLIGQIMSSRLRELDNRWVDLICRCCRIKAEVVAADERETGTRQILNFGHTFGHALEALTSYRQFRHGEAVGYGMILAVRLACNLEVVEPEEAQRIEAAVRLIGPLPPIGDISIEAWLERMRHDKKTRGDQLTFILPTRIGAVEIVTGVPLPQVEKTLQQFLSP